MTQRSLPQVPYGAVYFRKSNPPAEDWAGDYATAAADGMNTFRHWFLWSAIEQAPGVYDWADYDRQLDLAAEHGIATIIAEMITVAPLWAYRAYPHARYETRDGRRLGPQMHGSCVVAGAPGLCLDNDDARGAAERFLRALVTRYRDHPGLGGYDVWNECNYGRDVCYCPATVAKFRTWLQARYGDLQTLGEVWHHYSLATWEDVAPPRHLGPYPDTLDWLRFRTDNAYRLMRWRVDLIRDLDPDHPIAAHGTAGTLTGLAPETRDDWRAAAEVDVYGLTWVACRKGDAPWQQWHAVDMTRCATTASDPERRFWHAEAQGGPLWLQPQVIGRSREDGRIPAPEDLRAWHMTSFAAGATGLLYPRWRPLLDGPLFGAFGPYDMDGARTPRSEMASRIATWANDPAQADLWAARPVRGEVGLLVVPEAQLLAYGLLGETESYARAVRGAYRGFFAQNIQADFVRLDAPGDAQDALANYDLLYLPFPLMLTQATADRLRAWVAAGGVLVAEGCPGYFGDHAHAGETQPNLGLDALFGAREADVEFTPDLLTELTVAVAGEPVRGGFCLQTYAPTTGTPVGWCEDGRVVAVDHAHGLGRTRLIGTMVGMGTGRYLDTAASACETNFFAALPALAGRTPHVRTSDPRITARIHADPAAPERVYLWVANPTRTPVPVRLTLGEAWGPFAAATTRWGAEATVAGRKVALTAPARDVTVLALA